MSLKNIPAYLRERFPPMAIFLFAVLYLTVTTVCLNTGKRAPESFWWQIPGILACISFFFRLRVMDEIKDLHIDRRVHPERAVVQGKVSIRELVLLCIPGLLLEAVWSFMLSTAAGYAWLTVLTYTLIMRYEFFAAPFLEKRLPLYAALHMMVMPLVVWWIWMMHSPSGIMESELLLLGGIAFFAACAFEVARKTYAPDAEPPEIVTYSKLLGVSRSSQLSMGLLLINCLALLVLFLRFGLPLGYLLIPLLPFLLATSIYKAAVQRGEDRLFRLAEGVVSLVMVINYLELTILLWPF